MSRTSPALLGIKALIHFDAPLSGVMVLARLVIGGIFELGVIMFTTPPCSQRKRRKTFGLVKRLVVILTVTRENHCAFRRRSTRFRLQFLRNTDIQVVEIAARFKSVNVGFMSSLLK